MLPTIPKTHREPPITVYRVKSKTAQLAADDNDVSDGISAFAGDAVENVLPSIDDVDQNCDPVMMLLDVPSSSVEKLWNKLSANRRVNSED